MKTLYRRERSPEPVVDPLADLFNEFAPDLSLGLADVVNAAIINGFAEIVCCRGFGKIGAEVYINGIMPADLCFFLKTAVVGVKDHAFNVDVMAHVIC